jgi:hypothetical protein
MVRVQKYVEPSAKARDEALGPECTRDLVQECTFKLYGLPRAFSCNTYMHTCNIKGLVTQSAFLYLSRKCLEHRPWH